jgi:hypothetical protein
MFKIVTRRVDEVRVSRTLLRLIMSVKECTSIEVVFNVHVSKKSMREYDKMLFLARNR